MTRITYKHAGYDGHNNSITAIFANGIRVKEIATPKNGFVSCWQENELYEVQRMAKELYPEGFSLPYLVDQSSGYVYSIENNI